VNPPAIQRPAPLGDVHACQRLDVGHAAPAQVGAKNADRPQHAQVPYHHRHVVLVAAEE